MRSITQHYEGKNIYTRPLQGKPHYRNSGIIYAVDRSGNKYSVARVDLERFDDQNFQYVFTPDWDTIDSLPTSIFQGIHGLDMSMRLERYYRVNMMPYFISERTPSEKREDLWELLEEVGLDYTIAVFFKNLSSDCVLPSLEGSGNTGVCRLFERADAAQN